MIKYLNLQFFKGGTDVQEVEKRQPKSEQLKAMDTGMYNIFGGIVDRYGGVSMPSGLSSEGRSSGSQYDLSRIPGAIQDSWGRILIPDNSRNGRHVASSSELDYLRAGSGGSGQVGGGTKIKNGSFLDQAFNTADQQAARTNSNIDELLMTTPEYLRKHQNFLSQGTDEGFENYIRASEEALANMYSKNVGTDLSSLASRGILNSSVTNRALANQQAEIGDAAAKNRDQGASMYLDNYIKGYNTGMEGLKTQTELIPMYYRGALAPLMPAYDFWNQSTKNWLADEKDYVATSSGK